MALKDKKGKQSKLRKLLPWLTAAALGSTAGALGSAAFLGNDAVNKFNSDIFGNIVPSQGPAALFSYAKYAAANK